MLVLSRKKNQAIVIDGNITIEILQIKGNTIRLGINAPDSVRVMRAELKPFGMETSEGSVEFTTAPSTAPSIAPSAAQPIASQATQPKISLVTQAG